MFETIAEESAADAYRRALIAPLLGIALWLGYLTAIPLVASVPRAVFEVVRCSLTAAVAVGLIRGLGAFRRHKVTDARDRMVVLLWIATTLLTARLAVELSLPWLL